MALPYIIMGLLAVLSIILCFTLWGRMKHALQMLQQCHYMNDRFTNWIAGHRLNSFPTVLSVFVIAYWVVIVLSLLMPLSFMTITIPLLIITAIGAFLSNLTSFKSKESKLPLKITARVWRLIGTAVLVMLAISGVAMAFVPLNLLLQLPGWVLTFNLFAYMIVLFANKLNKPLETQIRLGFINDARRIVKSSKDLDVIGVTGSYGKTSTKHALNAILSEQFNTLMTPESYNTPMGITCLLYTSIHFHHELHRHLE